VTPHLLDAWRHSWLVVIGCSVVLVLWHTSLVAIVLEAWRHAWPRAGATRHYAAAVTALMVAFILTMATPALLAGRWLAPPATAAAIAARPIAAGPITGPYPSRVQRAPASIAGTARAVTDWLAVTDWIPAPSDRLALILGIVWLAGVALGLARVAGGWMLAFTIRRRAVDVRTPSLVDELRRHASELGVSMPALLLSPNVEAPVVLGALAPAVILPDEATQQLTADTISPLLAHELAHVKRRDYAVNLAQSCVAALLWFSPGAWLINRRVREAREYCCDDIAVRQCGSPTPYVDALTTLAALNVTTRRTVSLGIAGPRLIERIRRQLQEDVMPPFVRIRLASLLVALAATAVAGPALVRLSAAGVAAAQDAPDDYKVPYMYSPKQSGSSLTMRAMDPTERTRCGIATLRNDANVAVTAIRFVAVVQSQNFDRSVQLVTSGLRPVSIPAGGELSIDMGLVSPADAFAIEKGEPAQVGCLLKEVRFANDARWIAALNETATSVERAISLEQPRLARRVITEPLPSPDGIRCLDQNRKSSSPGAMMVIDGEPGHVAQCELGRWVERLPAR
jgi:beta-lactamase regulating signal transducer with metallopeptidase domain